MRIDSRSLLFSAVNIVCSDIIDPFMLWSCVSCTSIFIQVYGSGERIKAFMMHVYSSLHRGYFHYVLDKMPLRAKRAITSHPINATFGKCPKH